MKKVIMALYSYKELNEKAKKKAAERIMEMFKQISSDPFIITMATMCKIGIEAESDIINCQGMIALMDLAEKKLNILFTKTGMAIADIDIYPGIVETEPGIFKKL